MKKTVNVASEASHWEIISEAVELLKKFSFLKVHLKVKRVVGQWVIPRHHVVAGQVPDFVQI